MPDLETGEMQEIANEDAAGLQETVENESSPTEEQVEEGATEQGEKTPEVQEKKEEEKVVPLKALKDERQKRQDYERELAEERGKIKAFEQMFQNFNKPQEPEIDPDEPLTRGQVNEILRKEREANSLQSEKTRVAQSAEAARARYKDAEFTYDDAFDWAVKQKNVSPAVLGGLLADDNPGQALYDYVMIKNPELKNKSVQTAQVEAVKKTAEAINRHINTPRTLSNAGGTDKTLDQIKAIDNLSWEDFEKLVAENINKQSG